MELLSQGDNVRVIQPASLIEDVIANSASVLRMYDQWALSSVCQVFKYVLLVFVKHNSGMFCIFAQHI